MTPADIVLRAATTADDAFVVEMARHACVIEDRPLPDADDDEVLEMLPPAGVVPIIAENRRAEPLGSTLRIGHLTADDFSAPGGQWGLGTSTSLNGWSAPKNLQARLRVS
jgi:hypothetical protein